ncbi:MAG: hypothetical protein ACOC9S_04290 [Planctomycetota bacterium]
MVTVEQATAGDGMPWRIYDTMHDRSGSQASLGRHGIVPAHVFMKNRFYERGAEYSKPPTEKRVKEFARKIPHEVLTCMDLEGEDWMRLVSRKESGDFYLDEDSYQAFLEIARAINEVNPELRWGFFVRPPNSFPAKKAWRTKRKGYDERAEEYLQQWLDLQDEMIDLYEEVDVIFIATYYTSRNYDSFDQMKDWLRFYLEHYDPPVDIPVYIFMCPLDPYTNTSTGADFLTAEQWRWCMEFAREHTDGLLLWSDVPFDWDTHAKGRPWWDETKKFPTRTPDQNGE